MPVMEEAALADTGAGASRLDHPNDLLVPHETGRRPQRLQVLKPRCPSPRQDVTDAESV